MGKKKASKPAPYVGAPGSDKSVGKKPRPPKPIPPPPLTITCPGPQAAVSPDGNAVAVTWPNATTTGGVNPVTVTYVPTKGSAFAVGVTPVTATAHSSDGQTATCQFAVTVTYVPPPSPTLTITCPGSQTAVSSGGQSVAVTWPDATTNGGVAPVTIDYSPAKGSLFPVGVTTVTAVANSSDAQTASCQFSVTVTLASPLPPPVLTITCPGSQSAQSSDGQPVPVSWPNATATGGTAPVSIAYSRASGSLFAVGVTTVTATATSGDGQTAHCQFNVTVTQAAPPQIPTLFIACPGSQTAVSSDGNPVVVTWPAATTVGGTAPVTIGYVPASGSSFAVGVTTVVATAHSADGQTATCQFAVTVTYVPPPSPTLTITCPGAQAAQSVDGQPVSMTWPDATTAGGLAPVTISYNPAKGSAFPAGVTTVVATAHSSDDQTATCQFPVTITIVQPPQPTPNGVLAPSHFAYKGMFKPPSTAAFSFSQGLMTGRRVGGVASVLLSGPEIGPPYNTAGATDLNELAIPADNVLTTDPQTCPSATLIRSWPVQSIWNGVVLPNSGPPDNNYQKITGIFYIANARGNGTELLWTYASAYGDPGYFPNVMSSILNNAGTSVQHGPWGSQDTGWESLCGCIVAVPASVQVATGCGPYAFGAQVRGNSGASPWGTNLQVGFVPTIGTPADTILTKTMTTRPAIAHDMAHAQARNNHYRWCGPNEPNQAYDPSIQACPSGQILSASNDGQPANPPSTQGPYPVFGLPLQYYPQMGLTLDWIDCLAWIEGPNRHGVIAFGQLAETISRANGFTQDLHYTGSDPTHAHVGYGSNPCCHGQIDVTFQGNGPYSGSLAHYGWIYDPADLVKILNGTIEPYAATPTATFHMHDIASGIPEQRLQKYAFGGAWFDAVDKRLYLSERGRIRDGYDALPVIHVFDVNC